MRKALATLRIRNVCPCVSHFVSSFYGEYFIPVCLHMYIPQVGVDPSGVSLPLPRSWGDSCQVEN